MPEAFVDIKVTPREGEDDGHDIKIETDLKSTDETVTMLLLVVENMTGVSTDGYIRMVDECRRIAAREESANG